MIGECMLFWVDGLLLENGVLLGNGEWDSYYEIGRVIKNGGFIGEWWRVIGKMRLRYWGIG